MNTSGSKPNPFVTGENTNGGGGFSGDCYTELPRPKGHGQPGRSGPPGNSNARKSGGYTASRELKELKRRALDGRTTEARLVREIELELCSALGGEDEVSPQRRMLIQRAAILQLQLSALDSFVLTMPSLVHRKRRALHPVVREAAALAQTLTSLLQAIGLDRKPRPVDSLADYTRRRSHDGATAPESDDPDDMTDTTNQPAAARHARSQPDEERNEDDGQDKHE